MTNNRISKIKIHDHLVARVLPSGKLFVFWELHEEKVQFISQYFNDSDEHVIKTLRLYKHGPYTSETYLQEVVLPQGVSSWLFKGIDPDQDYVLEIGILRNGNSIFPLLRSNELKTKVNSPGSYSQLRSRGAPGWTGQVSTYTYYENLEGSNRK